MGVREQQKQATRAKVIDAARDLFDSEGYEETTIRAIAEKAGVSVGSVFTTFASKAEILGQIMAERVAALAAELERVVPHLRGSVVDRLSALLAIHYDFQMRRPKLFLAYIATSFSARHESGFTPVGSNPALRAPVRDILNDAVERGEIVANTDVELAMDTVIALHTFNYLQVAGGATASDLTQRMDRELKQFCDGLSPR